MARTDDVILRKFAETYPYSFDELKEMLKKGKHRKTAESLVAYLKEENKKDRMF